MVSKGTLLVAENKTGYHGVYPNHRSKDRPFVAQVTQDGRVLTLGCFSTAEEAAMCVARSPKGQAMAVERAAAAPPLTRQEARQQAQAEGLTLLVGRIGFRGVYYQPGKLKEFVARVKRSGKLVTLGRFVTAEEAALCVARTPEGRAVAAERAAAAPSLTSEEARQQAQAEGLTLRLADNKSGFLNVYLKNDGKPKPFEARVNRRGGSNVVVSLGTFATAEEAALCVARSPEGQAAAVEDATAAQPMTSEEARQQAQAEGLTLRVADNGTGYFGVALRPGNPSKSYQARMRRGGKQVSLGSFTTAEEAALYLARLPEGQAAAQRAAAAPPPIASGVGGGGDTGEEGEEEFEVLDAVEVHDDDDDSDDGDDDDGGDDDDDDESLALEAEGVVERKRARESTRLGDEEPRASSMRQGLAGKDRHR